MIGLLENTASILQRMAPGIEDREHRVSSSVEDDPQALQRACRQFEAFFIYYLLKVMRKTIPKAHLIDGGRGEEIHQSLMDQEMARRLAASGGIGLAGLLLDRLRPEDSDRSEQVSIEHRTVINDEAPSFLSPLRGEVTSPYGMRPDPFTGALAFHRGIDLAAREGTSVRASALGRVIKSGEARGYGDYVVIAHHDAYTTLYAHLQDRLVDAGDQVERGQVIGRVGKSGRATGPHLHFEVQKDDRTMDPTLVVRQILAHSGGGLKPLSAPSKELIE